MLPKLYLETTIPSYLTARRSRDLRLAADQEATEQWWQTQRHEYELYVSETVHFEVARGEAAMAEARLKTLAGIIVLKTNSEVDALVEELKRDGIIPDAAAADALHIALAAVNGMDFLLTWNCKHINNPNQIRRIERACRTRELVCPVICTPGELLPL